MNKSSTNSNYISVAKTRGGGGGGGVGMPLLTFQVLLSKLALSMSLE